MQKGPKNKNKKTLISEETEETKIIINLNVEEIKYKIEDIE